MGHGGPRHGAGWGAPPLLSAQTAFALGRAELHRLLSPSRDSWRVPAVGGVCGLPGAGQWAGALAPRGDAGPAPCPPSPVGVCGVRRGPGTTGRNRFDWPGEALSRSAGVEPAWLTPGCRRPTQPPGAGGGLGAVGRSWALASACLCGVPSQPLQGHLRGSVLTAGMGSGHNGALCSVWGGLALAGWPGSAHLCPSGAGRTGWGSAP